MKWVSLAFLLGERNMADSNITKQALSNALKELLEEQSFEKISVSDICERCHMNRKSFYYHFKDKYDLVNWIFDTEFVEVNQVNTLYIQDENYSFDDRWKNIEITCNYFYENRTFYRRVLKVDGQNSFVSHFREFIHPLLRLRVEDLLGMHDVPELVYDFVVDGVIWAIKRWLLDKNCVSTEEFMFSLKKMIQILYIGLERRISEDPKWLE